MEKMKSKISEQELAAMQQQAAYTEEAGARLGSSQHT